MEIKVFEGLNKNELSMIEVAHAILEQKADVMDFSDLVNQIQTYLGKSDSEIRDSLSQFYTDLNIDGSFISLGENRWGLRSWYAIDSIDEELNHGLDEDEEEATPRKRKRKRVNAFINDDEDAIDYNDDDPEDTDLADAEDDKELYDDDDDDDDDEEIAEYNSDLQEIGADEPTDDEVEVPGGIEEDLSIIDDDDDSFDDEEEE
ncbi:DNA-directed RNA polymerase subunit delta [Enterococcus asini]|uniref:Probable DNA-directed RNA polymerase subunit delta n=2 Tax=Enterococcus asini TaxID=57732 RepID=R2S5I0_9ENTE|nr:DNA-directed RNA polymerase subunit delta [Enterococcus asini]EOH90765.1 DNA-directed RNA polymerase subunit delta [Enterococcus asini ATCC 700915]EOT56603.1 DNA-directed RNA polymerase subunit delta [Enterococcus asini ATCC 700915]MCD5030238.1 DNA-directed RNA polymerase subunit delta [Enterococcus asini]MDT2763460.1 DNA-directed RNA polymerase subunit delta [Enterococcus asini]MDT2784985.1 DNA-directed RNA polymerase subunit delta [Enterococcus asini]